MTVGELIEELSKFQTNRDVYIEDLNGYFSDVLEIKESPDNDIAIRVRKVFED